MVWAVLHAEAAVVAETVVLCHMEKLELRLSMEYLKKVSEDAECTQKDSPRNVRAKSASNSINSEEHTDPYPELERVGNRSERAEVAAPEHVDEEASEHDDADGYD